MIPGIVAFILIVSAACVRALVEERRRRAETRAMFVRHSAELAQKRAAWLRAERAAALGRIEREPNPSYRAYLYSRFVDSIEAGDYE